MRKNNMRSDESKSQRTAQSLTPIASCRSARVCPVRSGRNMGDVAWNFKLAAEHERFPLAATSCSENNLSSAASDSTIYSRTCSQESSFRSGISMRESMQVFHSLTSSCRIQPSQLTMQPAGKKIGEGGFALVQKALLFREGDSPQVVAVKQLSDRAVRENPSTSLKDFLWEASILSQMQHSCITELIGVGGCDPADADLEKGPLAEKMFVVQEYLDGGDLRKLLMKQMSNPHRRIYRQCDALRWILQVAHGLRYLHNCTPAVVHRDLKPDNIGLQGRKISSANAKILDFGLHALINGGDVRKPRNENLSTVYTEDACATEDGTMTCELVHQASPGDNVLTALEAFGAPASTLAGYQLTGNTGSYSYMAPETFKCLPYDEKVDVYSFGMIMYELLTYELKFMALAAQDKVRDDQEYAEMIADGWRPPLPAYIPEPLSQLISSCWAQHPAERPSMNRVVMMLRAYVQEQGLDLSCSVLPKTCRTAGDSVEEDAVEGARRCGCNVM